MTFRPQTIIDAHHHYWDPRVNYHPWLSDEQMIEFRYGDYSSLKQPFLPVHYQKCVENWAIAATVTMEGEWDPSDPTGEALWMQTLNDRYGVPAAHVAQAWLDRDDLPHVLETYRDLALVKSVRHKPRSNAKPGGRPGGMCDQKFIQGFALLADYGLSFDLQTPWWHLSEADCLSRRTEDVPIVLNHAGLPADRTTQGIQQWRAAIQRFACLPNTFVKISGIGQPGRPWLLDENRIIIETCIEVFGEQRSMFASNFPVDGLCASFDTIYSGYVEAVKDCSDTIQQALFWQTAANIYQIQIDAPILSD